HAIPTGIVTFVNEPIRLSAPVHFGDSRIMPRLGCPNELVILDAEPLPQIDVLRGDPIGELLRRNPLFRGGAFDFLPMLIGACQQAYLKTRHLLVAADGVGNDRGIGHPARWRIDVVKWLRVVKGLWHRESV